jgi:DNA processing protein
MADDRVRLARAYLLRVAEPPAPAVVRFVAEHGPEVAARLVREARVPAGVQKATGARRELDRSEEDLRLAEAVGARLVTPEDDEWPAAAVHCFDLCGHEHLAAPLALWVRGPGQLGALTDRSVAIVGARASSGYGDHVANSLGYGVAGSGCTVFSGAAFGIDGAAHRGALAAGGVTVAVLACGIDQFYPAAHERLAQEIGATGLVVSEYPPGSSPARHRFLVRNRLIAGLAAGTVVVEAGWRSGARRTASDASLLGRPVMAVPGPVTSTSSMGCHRLLREPGTVAVTTAEEILEEVGRIGIDLARSPTVGARRRTDGLASDVLRVHEALPIRKVAQIPQLSVESGLPAELVRGALAQLQRRGLAEQVTGGWRLAPGAAP